MSDATAAGRIVRCYHCQKMMKVSSKALSVFCPHCQNRLTLEDLRITTSHPGKRLSTCGDIVVERSAQLHLEVFGKCITILGRVRGPVVATEWVEVGAGGHVIGDIRAPKIVVREGALITGRCEMTKFQRSADDTRQAEAASRSPVAAIPPVAGATAPAATGPVPRPLRPPQ